MTAETILLIATLAAAIAALAVGVAGLLRRVRPDTAGMERRLLEEMRASRRETAAATQAAVQAAAQTQADTQRQLDARQDVRLRELREQMGESQAALQRAVTTQLAAQEERLNKFSLQSEQKLEGIRRTMEERVAAMQAGNEKKLEEMRRTVDEKLQKTLDTRLRESFGLVQESLGKVQSGLGEMRTLAEDVGSLQKVLSGVKTRGILGEIQLGAILEEILPPEQYAQNVETVRGSGCRVEYAVRLPGASETERIWLPIDAKFSLEPYALLLDAYETADADQIKAAARTLEVRVLKQAQDIHEKYIRIPETTEFAILFLPVEGLYAEVVRRGLVEKLQQKRYRVNIAGPTTLAALLNSLQMGFRTLQIQKSSGEVLKVLEDVKTEFDKFGDYLEKTKDHLNRASSSIDTLLGTRTNQMRRRLHGVTRLTALQDGADDLPDSALPQAADAELPDF